MDEIVFKEFQKQHEEIERMNEENKLLRKILDIKTNIHSFEK